MYNFFLNRSPIQLAVISGLIVGLSYQPLSLFILAYIGFIPLIFSWLHNNVKNNILSGYTFGIIYNLISNYWMATNSGAEFIVVLFSLISAVIYLSIFWGLAGALVGIVKKQINRLAMLPFLVVAVEWLRSFGPLGFPWGNLALTQTEILPLLQYIEYTGNYIIALFILSINVLIYYNYFISKFSKFSVASIITIILLFIGGGVLKIYLKSNYNFEKQISVAIIQPNLDPNKKWDNNTRSQNLSIMDSLHRVAINLEPDFILFPETALPTYLRINNKIREKLQSLVDISNIPILIGTVDRRIDSNGTKLYYNSSMYLKPYSTFEIYDKIHLVPFAEYDLIPSLLHPLGELNLNIERGVFKGGDNYKIFKFKNIKFSNLICYESSLPRYSRKFAKNGAQILMIQANDGWLGNSAGPYQHFEHARLRAIENCIPVIRCGNTGISGVISHTGDVERKIPIGTQDVIKETISLVNSTTFYSQYGDVFSAFCFVLSLFIGPVLSCLRN